MASLERVKVMIIDDSIHMIHIVKSLLRGFGCKLMVEAKDAGEAFDRLKSDQVDLIICDYQMEVLDGIDFVRLVRNSSDSTHRYVPIIMLTAHSDRSRVVAARDAGVTEFCCKPVTAIELYRKIMAVVNFNRPYIKTSTFFGPDRRRKTNTVYEGKERRRGDELAL